jgi:hypothetical protein
LLHLLQVCGEDGNSVFSIEILLCIRLEALYELVGSFHPGVKILHCRIIQDADQLRMLLLHKCQP